MPHQEDSTAPKTFSSDRQIWVAGFWKRPLGLLILSKTVLQNPSKPCEILIKPGEPHKNTSLEPTQRKIRITLEAVAAAAAGRMWRAGFLKLAIACCC